jgi:hypothetical protein
MKKLPLHIRQRDESFIISDDAGLMVCALYYENERGRQNAKKRMDEVTPREMAKRIARISTGNC